MLIICLHSFPYIKEESVIRAGQFTFKNKLPLIGFLELAKLNAESYPLIINSAALRLEKLKISVHSLNCDS